MAGSGMSRAGGSSIPMRSASAGSAAAAADRHGRPRALSQSVRSHSPPGQRMARVLAGAQGNGEPVKRARIEMAKADLHACAIQEPDHLYKCGTLKGHESGRRLIGLHAAWQCPLS